MQDYAKLYRSRYRDAEELDAVATLRMIRKIARLPINPMLMLTAIIALAGVGPLRK